MYTYRYYIYGYIIYMYIPYSLECAPPCEQPPTPYFATLFHFWLHLFYSPPTLFHKVTARGFKIFFSLIIKDLQCNMLILCEM